MTYQMNGEVNTMELTKQFGSPLYVYDLGIVSERAKELREQLPQNSQIYYSLKSNPLPSIVNHLVKQGCRLEVTSENELAVACNSGIDNELILYGGPGKTESEIKQALVFGVRQFSVESWVDWERISMIASNMNISCRALLRVNPSKALNNGLSMSGTKSQFGFEEDDVIGGWSRVEQSKSLKVIGFHIYYGTQMKNSAEIADAAYEALQSVERICEKTNFTPEVVNLGGGFPWAYAKEQTDTNINGLAPQLEKHINEFSFRDKAEIWFESGRYLSASSGTLVSKVLDIKKSKDDSVFVVLDSGINTLGGMSGIGRIPRGYNATKVISSDESKVKNIDGEFVANLVGPLCSPLDCMNRKQLLPNFLQIGDLITIPNVGAYGLTASLVAFLTRPPAIEVVLLNNSVTAVHRLRHGHENLTDLYKLEEELNHV